MVETIHYVKKRAKTQVVVWAYYGGFLAERMGKRRSHLKGFDNERDAYNYVCNVYPFIEFKIQAPRIDISPIPSKPYLCGRYRDLHIIVLPYK